MENKINILMKNINDLKRKIRRMHGHKDYSIEEIDSDTIILHNFIDQYCDLLKVEIKLSDELL
jgi:hypothetical protein